MAKKGHISPFFRVSISTLSCSSHFSRNERLVAGTSRRQNEDNAGSLLRAQDLVRSCALHGTRRPCTTMCARDVPPRSTGNNMSIPLPTSTCGGHWAVPCFGVACVTIAFCFHQQKGTLRLLVRHWVIHKRPCMPCAARTSSARSRGPDHNYER